MIGNYLQWVGKTATVSLFAVVLWALSMHVLQTLTGTAYVDVMAFIGQMAVFMWWLSELHPDIPDPGP